MRASPPLSATHRDAAWNEEQSALHERIEELRGEIAESEEQRRDPAEYVGTGRV